MPAYSYSSLNLLYAWRCGALRLSSDESSAPRLGEVQPVQGALIDRLGDDNGDATRMHDVAVHSEVSEVLFLDDFGRGNWFRGMESAPGCITAVLKC